MECVVSADYVGRRNNRVLGGGRRFGLVVGIVLRTSADRQHQQDSDNQSYISLHSFSVPLRRLIFTANLLELVQKRLVADLQFLRSPPPVPAGAGEDLEN